MPVQQIELQEVTMVETTDESLEASVTAAVGGMGRIFVITMPGAGGCG